MITAVESDLTKAQAVSLSLWQDDFKPAIAAGNKRFKLSAVINSAKNQQATSVLTFGGAWSNHIHAIAYQTQRSGLGSIGIIRGDNFSSESATLHDARHFGMELHFVSRAEYRERHDQHYLEGLQRDYPDALIVPEGGSSLSAVGACAEILQALDQTFVSKLHTVACAVGTGATVCGLQQQLRPNQNARGYAVVPDETRIDTMQSWMQQLGAQMPVLIPAYQPRYGQVNGDLLHFIDDFYLAHGVLLDPLYTGKMMQQLMQEIAQGEFPAGAGVLAIHTGGLQGWRGFLTQAQQALSRPTMDAVLELTENYTLGLENE